MKEWKKVKLKDITISITDGKHGDCKGQDNSGYYFISCKDVSDGTIHYENARQITKEDFIETDKRTNLATNDILITNSGTIGRMAFVKDIPETRKTTFQKSVAIVKPNTDKVLPIYLYYLLQSKVSEFVNSSNGAAQKNLLLSTMREFELSIEESFSIQQRIATILSRYDSLIENYQKQIKLLEESAQRLYKEWFIDFRFPGHENTKIVDGVPEGWKKANLGTLVEFKRGKTITKKETVEGHIPVVAGGLEPAYYCNKSNTSERVITISASGANAGYTKMYFEKVWASDCSFADNSMTPYLHFIFCFLRDNKTTIDNMQKGSAQPHVYAKDINAMELCLPETSILQTFEEKVSKCFDTISSLIFQIHLLTEARDRLLPKLINRNESLIHII